MNKSLMLMVGVVVAACSSTDPAEDGVGDASVDSKPRCAQVQDEWERRAELAVSDLTHCNSDGECSRFFTPSFKCGTLEVSSCPIAIREEFANDIDAMRTRTWPVSADICEHVEAGCTADPSLCGRVEPRCIQNRCTLIREPVDESTLACGRPLIRPDAVKTATRSPDGAGFCCATDRPTCHCGSFGGFVKDRCECGSMRIGFCDLAPPDWISGTDEHGCNVYSARFPTTACCNCPRDAAVAPAPLAP